MVDTTRAGDVHEPPKDHPEVAHRDVRGGGVRAAIFGVNDGLVSNAALVLGMDGAHPAVAVVRLAGLAGLLAGAVSMAAGEYVSMRAQSELLGRELAIEAAEIRRHPNAEHAELMSIYQRRGVRRDLADELATALMDTPDHALAAHAREELGIDPDELGSPLSAAAASFAAFAVGALVPLVGFWWSTGGMALVLALTLTGTAAVAIGIGVSLFTATTWWRAALRQLTLCGGAIAVAFAVGALVGSAGIAGS